MRRLDGDGEDPVRLDHMSSFLPTAPCRGHFSANDVVSHFIFCKLTLISFSISVPPLFYTYLL